MTGIIKYALYGVTLNAQSFLLSRVCEFGPCYEW